MSHPADELRTNSSVTLQGNALVTADDAIVSREIDFAGLATLMDPSRALEWLRRQASWLEIESLEPNYLKYKPRTSCLASFVARGNGAPAFVYLKGFAGHARHKVSKAALRAARDSSGVVIDSRLGVAAYLFPQDAVLSSLADMLNPTDRLQEEWRAHFPTDQLSVKAFRYKPERRFVGALMGAAKPVAAVKLYAGREYDRAQRNAKILSNVRGARLPRRLERCRKQKYVLSEWLTGVQLREAMAQQLNLTDVAERVGATLATLHSHRCRGLRHAPSDLANVEARTAMAAIANVLPNAAHRTARLAREIADGLADQNVELCVCHGDFYLDQVLVDDEIALLDLDNACIGDPARDLGNFIAHLEREAFGGLLRPADVDLWRSRLLAGYQRVRPLPNDDRISRHVALGLLKLAIEPFRQRQAHWPMFTELILNRAGKAHEQIGRVVSALSAPKTRLHPPPSPANHPVVHDDALPNAKHATNLSQAAAAFAASIGPSTNSPNVSVVAARVVRHKPGRRCLIEYDIADLLTGRVYGIIAKMGRRRVARRDFLTQRSIHDAGFQHDAADGIYVPEPLGIIDQWNTWLQRKVVGTVATELLTGPHGPTIAVRIAAALSKLHTQGPPTNRLHSLDDELAILRDRLETLAANRPQWTYRLEAVLAKCVRIASNLPVARSTPIHRDFYPDQVMVDGTNICLCDLDLYCMGDPSLDIGNFVAHLIELGLREHDDPAFFDRSSAAFIEAYRSLCAERHTRSVDVYTKLSLARLIAIDAAMPNRSAIAERLLIHCESMLR